ncbi:MAG: hypothetical protein KGJ86_11355 [Chloroflexota bacterium]|nr:hypothetical protein [Chloroflexota bacterium]
MAVIQSAWADGAPSTGGQGAAVIISSGFKLCRVEVRGAVTQPGLAAVQADWFEDAQMWGIQAIPNGSPTLVLPADIGSPDWLAFEARPPGEVVADWAPNTATAAALTAGGFRLTWAGQLFVSGDTYISFVHGLLIPSSPGWLTYGSIRAWYA